MAAPAAATAPAARSTRSEQRTPQRLPVRRRVSQAITDRYYIDPSWVPPGMCWEWKRYDYAGIEDQEHQANLQEYGAWEHVLTDRAPKQLTGRNPKPGQMVKRGNLVLMERPKELTAEARAEDEMIARDQVQTQEKRLGLNRGRGKKVTPGLNYRPSMARENDATELAVPGDDDEEDETE